jgi:hypothetical protein
VTTKRQIKWLIAHHPQYLFIRTAKYFSQELEKLLPGEFEIEILTIPQYLKKYNDIDGLNIVGPSVPGLEEATSAAGFEKANNFEAVDRKWGSFFRAIEDGRIALSQTQVTVIGSIVDSDFIALDLPFLFKDHDHATRVLDGEIGEGILNNLTDKSFIRGLAFTYSGGYRVIGANKEIKSLQDLNDKGLLPHSLPSSQLFADLGTQVYNRRYSNPHDFADLVSNDGAVETTYLRFSGKYVLKTEHSMFLTSILTGDAFWNTLTEKQQAAFKQAAKNCAVIERKMSVKDTEMYEYYAEANGIKINRISEEELNRMKQVSKKTYARLEGMFSPNLVSKIMAAETPN